MQLPKKDMTSLFVDMGQDWSSKAIITALNKKSVSLRTLEQELGLSENSIRNISYRKVNYYQEAIAKAIGINPDVIWPSRYLADQRQSA